MSLEDFAKQRAEALAGIDPAQPYRQHHADLRSILAAEVAYRRDGGEDYYENLYWCAYLLFCIGDLNDVEALWEAKHTTFDTACGLDGQALLGAGLEATVRHAKSIGRPEIATYLEELSVGLDLAAWAAFRRAYFYG